MVYNTCLERCRRLHKFGECFPRFRDVLIVKFDTIFWFVDSMVFACARFPDQIAAREVQLRQDEFQGKLAKWTCEYPQSVPVGAENRPHILVGPAELSDVDSAHALV